MLKTFVIFFEFVVAFLFFNHLGESVIFVFNLLYLEKRINFFFNDFICYMAMISLLLLFKYMANVLLVSLEDIKLIAIDN